MTLQPNEISCSASLIACEKGFSNANNEMAPKRSEADAGLPRRGRQQRVRVASPTRNQSSNPRFESSAVLFLLQQWAVGLLSAPEVQRHAMHQYTDQLRLLRTVGANPDLADKSLGALARLGTSGRYTNNINTELLRYLGDPEFPPPYSQPIPMLRLKPSGDEYGSEILCDFPIFLPHVLFNYLYTHDRARFNELYLGGLNVEARENAWNELLSRGDQRLTDHPMRARRHWARRAIPLTLHGDAVPVLQVGKAGSKSFDAWSLMSLFCFGATLDVKMYIYGLFGKSATENTKREIWRVVSWSLHFAYLGKWPHVDPDGIPWTPDRPTDLAMAKQDLAGGHFLVLYSLKGDSDHYAKEMRLRHYNSNALCDTCPAGRDEADKPNLY